MKHARLFRLFFLPIFFLLSHNASAQSTFCRGGGIFEWRGFTRTYDGNVVTVGYVGSGGATMAKTAANGDTIWRKSFGVSGGNDLGTAVTETFNHRLVFCGHYYYSGVQNQVFITKLDEDGNFIWTRTYGTNASDEAFAIIETSDSGYVVAGTTDWSGGNGSSDLFVMKLDSSGNIAWSKVYGTALYDRGYDIIQTSDGGYALAGFSRNNFSVSTDNAYVLKLDAAGNIVWTKVLGSTISPYTEHYYYGIVEGTDGNFYCGGRGVRTPGDEDFLITQLSPTGTIGWSRYIGASGSTERMFADVVAMAPSGNILLGGQNIGSQANAALTEIDYSGNIVWAKRYTNSNLFYDVTSDGANGIYACGAQYFLTHTDSSGVSCCSDTLTFYSNPATLSVMAAGTAIPITWASGITQTPVVAVPNPLLICQGCSGITVSISPATPYLCTGDSTTLTATVSGGTAPYTYIWLPGGDTTSSINVHPLFDQTYTLTITDAGGICTTLDTFLLGVGPNAAITGDTLTCLGDSVLLTASGTGQFAWSWGSTAASVWVHPPATMTYSVTVTDAIHGCTGTATHTVQVDSCTAPHFCKLLGGYIPVGFDIVPTYGDGYAVCGYTSPPPTNAGQAYLSTFNGRGDFRWGTSLHSVTAGWGSTAQSVIQLPDSGYALTGVYTNGNASGQNVYAARYDKHGTIVWTHYINWGSFNTDAGFKIIATPDSGFFIAGATELSVGNDDMYAIKLDASGAIEWSKRYGGSGYEGAYGVVRANDGGYVLSGTTSSFGAGGTDFYVIKTDSLGNIVWTRTLGGSGDEEEARIVATHDGGYVIAGHTYSFGAGASDFYAAKLDSLGNVLWTQTYGTGLRELCHTIAMTNDSGFVLAGGSGPMSVSYISAYVVKLDRNGALQWTLSTPGTDLYEYYGAAALGDGSLVFTGLQVGPNTGFAPVVKIDPALTSCCLVSASATVGTGGITSSGGMATTMNSVAFIFTSPTYASGAVMDSCLVSIITETPEELPGETGALLYPNPSTGMVFFRSDAAVQRIEVYNSLGALVQENALPGGTVSGNVDLSGLPPGMYFFRVLTEKGTENEKILLAPDSR